MSLTLCFLICEAGKSTALASWISGWQKELKRADSMTTAIIAHKAMLKMLTKGSQCNTTALPPSLTS